MDIANRGATPSLFSSTSMPEFVRAYRRKDGELLYTFDVPASVAEGLPRGMYWRLMNATRQEPYFPRFVVTDSLKAEF